MKSSFIYLLCLTLVTLASAQAAPSVVTLDSGEQVIGELLPSSTPEMVVLQSVLLGEVKLPRDRVLSIETKKNLEESPAAMAEAIPEPNSAAQDMSEAEVEERKILDQILDFKAPDYWSGNLRFGINLSQGDRRWTQTYARGKLEIDPDQSPHFYRFNGSYTYRQTERSNGDEFTSTDQYDGQFIYRRTIYENWFIQNSIGGRVDQIKGINHEIQEAVGIGYKYEPSDKFELIVGGGGGVEKLDTEYEDERNGWTTLGNIFQEATWRPLKRTSLVQRFNYYWNPEDSDQYNYVFTGAIQIRLTELLGFEFSYNKSFDNDLLDSSVRDDTQWHNALVVYF